MPDLDNTTYEVVRRRLTEQATGLGEAVQALDGERRRLYGATETALLATHRVRTENACVPRDLVALMTPSGGRFVLGFEVVLGLRTKITPADVLTELIETSTGIETTASTLLTDAQFNRDFAEIFQYHKEARLLQLRRTDQHLLVVFQAGARLSDIKVLRFDLVPGGVSYRDNRGERDYVFPPTHDFTWTRTSRDQHVHGAHPHVNISDMVFVECIGGDLTVKIENNTATGQGIYAEPVDEPTQGLDDAEIFYAVLEFGILLRIKPYKERDFRHLVFNRRTREVHRIDELGSSCQQLPDAHGLIFPGGCYLADGTLKRFPVDTAGMEFKRVLRAPNGEDVCYVFYRRDLGTYLLLSYNLITREPASPIACHSYCRLPDGRLVILRAESEPVRIHTLQVWQTPFCSEEHHAAQLPTDDTFLAKLGNRELVRGVSDLLHLQRQAQAPTATRDSWEALLQHLVRCRDAYPWLDQVGDIRVRLEGLRTTAEQVVDEFEKVLELTASAARRVAEQARLVSALLAESARADHQTLDGHVQPLARMQAMRGQVRTVGAVRFADPAAIAELDTRLAKSITDLSGRTVEFLLGEGALKAATAEVSALEQQGSAADSVAIAAPVLERLALLASGLDTLVELIGTLDITDQTRRTAILERVTEVYANVGRAKAITANRRITLGQAEGRAAFAVQMQLLGQATANSLGLANDAARCDELAAKLMMQLEELEVRFGEFPEFLGELGAKRAEIADAFADRRQQVLDLRARHADGVAQALERILVTVAKRCQGVASVDALNAYLAADPLVLKAQALISSLRGLGAAVKADDAEGRLVAARDTGMRRLRDQGELFDDSGALKLGRHRFAVNHTPLELTLLARQDSAGTPQLVFHLTGTDYERAVNEPELLGTEALWTQTTEAESPTVYRSEHLAWCLLADVRTVLTTEELTERVRAFAIAHPDHGYERGIHDHDAVLILAALVHLREAGGLLRFSAVDRALAQTAWAAAPDEVLAKRCRALALVRAKLGPVPEITALGHQLATLTGSAQAGTYLFEELARTANGQPPAFVGSAEAVELRDLFRAWLKDQAVDALAGAPVTPDRELVTAWVRTWTEQQRPDLLAAVAEVVAELVHPQLTRETVSARIALVVEGLLGTHPRLREGRLELRLDEAASRLATHLREGVPAYRAYRVVRERVIARERARLRLAEFTPQVLTSFVRNRLVDEVFLPLIGDNLAKQIGALGGPDGAGRRTDLQGLLLLISPPGYGKTTLMEYLAAVLGLVFVKVNGPALGHQVTSLDPAAAPNLAARQEVERINLAFAMGSNVLLYLDDIQHTDPELLQKFISLCDGQRKIEGVWEGQSRTWDLRGKRFIVAMAGNPYTESGARFRIPDMLANRADTYNLGDIIGGSREVFALSYIENCLVANPVLRPLTARPPADVQRLLRINAGDDGARTELEYPYTASELGEVTQVLGHLQRIQQALLTINQAYIASAGQADTDRSEPPFKLQGSYRNMGKLAAKVVPAMTSAEIDNLLRDHYRQEAQTLTQGAEANLLKLQALLGWLVEPKDQTRWAEICRGFARRTELGNDDDPARQAVVQLAKVVEALAAGREIQAKVEVINTLPAYYAKLYEHHLRVLETSLIPVLDLLGSLTGNQHKTRAELEAIAVEMRQVMNRQQSAGRIDIDQR